MFVKTGPLESIIYSIPILKPGFVIICIFCFCLVAKLCPDLCHPWIIACQTPLSWDFPGRILEWVDISFTSHIPNQGIKPAFPASQVDSLGLYRRERPYYLYIKEIQARRLYYLFLIQIIKNASFFHPSS